MPILIQWVTKGYTLGKTYKVHMPKHCMNEVVNLIKPFIWYPEGLVLLVQCFGQRFGISSQGLSPFVS